MCTLSQLGLKGFLNIYPNPDQYEELLEDIHISIRGLHVLSKETMRQVLLDGYQWPILCEDAEEYIRICSVFSPHKPILHATLFQISPKANLSPYIVNYLSKVHTKEKLLLIEIRLLRLKLQATDSSKANSTKEEMMTT